MSKRFIYYEFCNLEIDVNVHVCMGLYVYVCVAVPDLVSSGNGAICVRLACNKSSR